MVPPAPGHVLREVGEGLKCASAVHLGGFFAARRNDLSRRRLGRAVPRPRLCGRAFSTASCGTFVRDRLLAEGRIGKRHPRVRSRRVTQGIQAVRESYQNGGLPGDAPATAMYIFDVFDTFDNRFAWDSSRHYGVYKILRVGVEGS